MTDITKEIQHWDAAAKSDTTALHNAIFGGPKLDEEFDRKTMQYVLRWMPHQGTILDLGCGIGRMAFPMATLRPEAKVIGLDISEAMLELARKPFLPENLTLVKGDGVHLPEDCPLDAAYSVAVMQHLPAEVVKGYLQQMARKLVSGGVFVFQFVRGDYQFFLSQAIPIDTMRQWVTEAGLNIAETNIDYPYENWVWMVVRKP